MFTEQERKRIQRMGRKNKTKLEASIGNEWRLTLIILVVIAAYVLLVHLYKA